MMTTSNCSAVGTTSCVVAAPPCRAAAPSMQPTDGQSGIRKRRGYLADARVNSQMVPATRITKPVARAAATSLRVATDGDHTGPLRGYRPHPAPNVCLRRSAGSGEDAVEALQGHDDAGDG